MEIKAFLTLLLLLFFFFFNVSINNCNENFLTIIGAILSIPFCLLLYSLINTKPPVIEEPTLMDQLANKLKDFGLISSSLLHSYVMMILAGITIWYLFTTSYKSLHLHKKNCISLPASYNPEELPTIITKNEHRHVYDVMNMLSSSIIEIDNMILVLHKADSSIRFLTRNTSNDKKYDANAIQNVMNGYLAQLNRIIDSTVECGVKLLDGDMGVAGHTDSNSIWFVSGGENTVGSSSDGYKVKITRTAKRSEVYGCKPLTRRHVDNCEKITLIENSKIVKFKCTPHLSVEENIDLLRKQISFKGLDLEIGSNECKKSCNPSLDGGVILAIRHKYYGSKYKFSVSSSSSGILTNTCKLKCIENGRDVQGSINSEPGEGDGRYLHIKSTQFLTSGIKLFVSSTENISSTLWISQKSMVVNLESERIIINIPPLRPCNLGILYRDSCVIKNLELALTKATHYPIEALYTFNTAICELNQIKEKLICKRQKLYSYY